MDPLRFRRAYKSNQPFLPPAGQRIRMRAHATERSARMKAIPGRTSTTFQVLRVSFVVAAALTACSQRPAPPPAISMDADDIAGTVSSSTGPEAGVWVIAETADFPTRFAKIVVT